MTAYEALFPLIKTTWLFVSHLPSTTIYGILNSNFGLGIVGENHYMENRHFIKIPHNLTMTSVDEIYRTMQLSQEICNVVFDFSDITFVTPYSLILIVTASRYFRDHFQRIVEWKNICPDVLGYLDRMGINELDFIRIDRPSVFVRRKYKTSDALVEFSVIDNVQQIGSTILKTKNVINRWFPGSQIDCKYHLLTLIKESVENSIEHSSAEPSNGFCYYVLQKYGYSDGSTEVQIAVGDIGIGMLASQRRAYPATRDDAVALNEVLIHGRSGRKSGGGMGYMNIKESLTPLHGKVYIRSGKAHVEYVAGTLWAKTYRHNFCCPGTQIVFQCRA